MKNKKKIVIANWKMNPETIGEAVKIFNATKMAVKDLKNTKVVICPPFVYLSDLEKLLSPKEEKQLAFGAQDMFWEKSGSYTGEISSPMLKGEKYVILGHSERRELGETNEIVAKKAFSAIKAGLSPILCFGEKERDSHGEYLHFLRQQIVESLNKVNKKLLPKVIIAYEPIWAIGKGAERALRATEVHEITLYIRKVLSEIYGQEIVVTIPILYGGSVNYQNAKDIILNGMVQGLLVGRESLKIEKFSELLKNVD